MAIGTVLHDKCNAVVFFVKGTSLPQMFFCPSCRTDVPYTETHIMPEQQFESERVRELVLEGRDLRFIK